MEEDATMPNIKKICAAAVDLNTLIARPSVTCCYGNGCADMTFKA